MPMLPPELPLYTGLGYESLQVLGVGSCTRPGGKAGLEEVNGDAGGGAGMSKTSISEGRRE